MQIDERSAAFYRNLPGSLGDRLRQVMAEEDSQTVMTITDGRCPMWQADGLCRIQRELGEEALCKTCREFPRLTHDYGDFVEMGLELSCPEAARILFNTPNPSYVIVDAPGGDNPDYDTDAMAILLQTREAVRDLLSDSSRPANEVLALLLMYGYHAQAILDGEEDSAFDPVAALVEARQFAAAGSIGAILTLYKGLEILSPDWPRRLDTPSQAPWSPVHQTLARYFVDRYWLQAVADYDLISRVKLAVISCILIRALGGDVVQTAQQYSKEIENSIDNLEAILDAAYQSQAFADNHLLGALLL